MALKLIKVGTVTEAFPPQGSSTVKRNLKIDLIIFTALLTGLNVATYDPLFERRRHVKKYMFVNAVLLRWSLLYRMPLFLHFPPVVFLNFIYRRPPALRI